MSKRAGVVILVLSAAVAVLLGCAGGGHPPQESPPVAPLYEEIQWAKLFNPTFARDLDGKAVQFTGMYLGPAASTMHMASGSDPWKDMVCIGLAPEGAQPGTGLDAGQYAGQQWGIYLPKALSEAAFTLKKGAIVRAYGRVSLFTGPSTIPGTSGTVQLIVIAVDRIDESK